MGYKIRVTRSQGQAAYLSAVPLLILGSYVLGPAPIKEPQPLVFADPDAAVPLLGLAKVHYANACLEHTAEAANATTS